LFYFQLIMKANTGINLHEFLEVVENITKLRNQSVVLKLSSEIKHHQEYVDADVIKKYFLSLIKNLLTLIEKCSNNDGNIAELQVPYEILDFCSLASVVIDMWPYYCDKNLTKDVKFVDILKICLCWIEEYKISLAVKLGF